MSADPARGHDLVSATMEESAEVPLRKKVQITRGPPLTEWAPGRVLVPASPGAVACIKTIDDSVKLLSVLFSYQVPPDHLEMPAGLRCISGDSIEGDRYQITIPFITDDGTSKVYKYAFWTKQNMYFILALYKITTDTMQELGIVVDKRWVSKYSHLIPKKYALAFKKIVAKELTSLTAPASSPPS